MGAGLLNYLPHLSRGTLSEIVCGRPLAPHFRIHTGKRESVGTGEHAGLCPVFLGITVFAVILCSDQCHL